ncbi:MAG: PQQ-binding-like beta-propeller repeat protein [Verrucomicrobiota bacterium]
MKKPLALPYRLTFLLLIVIVPSGMTRANEWTQFRGPLGSGIVPDASIPPKFTESDYNWSVPLNGRGHSSPVCWDNHVYITIVPTDRPNTRELRCIKIEDGSTVWTHSHEFEAYRNHKFNTAASTTPAVDGDHIYLYAATESGVLLQAINHEGTLAWERQWNGLAMEHGQAASPILVNNTLIIANDQLNEGGGFIMGLERMSGKTLWEHPRVMEKASYSTPGTFPHPNTESGKQVVFVSMTNGFTSVDPDTGKILWEITPGFRSRSVSTPVYTNGVLFATVGSGGGGKDSLALDLTSNPEKPETLYRLNKNIPYVPTPVAHNERIYLWQDGGILMCLDATSGEPVYEKRVTGNYFSSPILVGDHLWGFTRDENGRVVVVKAGDDFEIVGENELNSPVFATPAVHDGTMFIRTDDSLISLGSP